MNRRTAFHEAGHAVAQWVHRRRDEAEASVHFVTIVPNDETGGRVCDELIHDREAVWDGEEVQIPRLAVERSIVEFYAGGAAERLVTTDDVRPGCGSDDEQAARLIGTLRGDVSSLECSLRARADALVENYQHLIEALARELLERKTLDGFEVDCILEIAQGKNAAEQLPKYRAARDWHRPSASRG